jgi:hypothetical protein
MLSMNPTTDPFVAALLQLGTIMAACWIATEALGNVLRARTRRRIPKLALSCVLAPAFSVVAYAFGWFTALPATAAGGVPVMGGVGYGSAAFAGLVAALVTSGAHGLVKAVGRGNAPPPGPPAGGTA